MNSENSEKSDAHRIRFNLTHKMDLRRGDKCVVLLDHSSYRTWKNMKRLYRNNKFEISGTT